MIHVEKKHNFLRGHKLRRRTMLKCHKNKNKRKKENKSKETSYEPINLGS
jgi:hypothetical protein